MKKQGGASPKGSVYDNMVSEMESINTPMSLLKNRRMKGSTKENESPSSRRMNRHMAGD
jgi:hypothetical protein